MSARILVIEDNPTNLELMVYLFKAHGYAPLTASDGREGLEIAADQIPDLIVCDLEMPRVDGYQVGRQLKTNPRLRRIPLVAVTAYAMTGNRDEVLAAGFDGYIPKPIAPETFVKQVEAFLPSELRSGREIQRPSAANELPPGSATRATILVVDDSPVNLSLIRSTLEPSGYKVITAAVPKEAIVLARQRPLDLILSDLHMPGRSGLDFLREVKADPHLRLVPFLLCSASESDQAERERAFALGAEKFISRPIEPQALLSEVEACLRRAVGK
jgi:two-component system cell cycle response regulator